MSCDDDDVIPVPMCEYIINSDLVRRFQFILSHSTIISREPVANE